MEVVEGTATVADVDEFIEPLGAIGDEYGVAVQAFDARYVVDREHWHGRSDWPISFASG